MASIRLGPILSHLHGAIGGSVIENRRGHIIWKPRPDYAIPGTAAQVLNQLAYRRAAWCWKWLTAGIKAQYTVMAADLSMSGFNLFMQAGMQFELAEDGPGMMIPNSLAPTLQDVIVQHLYGQNKVRVDWNPAGWTTAYRPYIFSRTSYTGAPPYIGAWVYRGGLSIYMTAGTYTISGLSDSWSHCVCVVPMTAASPYKFGGSAHDSC